MKLKKTEKRYLAIVKDYNESMDLDDVNKKQDTVVKEMLKIGYAVNK